MPVFVVAAELVAAAEPGPGPELALAAVVEAAVVLLVDVGEAVGVVAQGYLLDLPAAVAVGEAAQRIDEGLS